MSIVIMCYYLIDGLSVGVGLVIDNGFGVVFDRKCLLWDKYLRLILLLVSCLLNGIDGLFLVDDNRDYRELVSVFFFVFRR